MSYILERYDGEKWEFFKEFGTEEEAVSVFGYLHENTPRNFRVVCPRKIILRSFPKGRVNSVDYDRFTNTTTVGFADCLTTKERKRDYLIEIGVLAVLLFMALGFMLAFGVELKTIGVVWSVLIGGWGGSVIGEEICERLVRGLERKAK